MATRQESKDNFKAMIARAKEIKSANKRLMWESCIKKAAKELKEKNAVSLPLKK